MDELQINLSHRQIKQFRTKSVVKYVKCSIKCIFL